MNGMQRVFFVYAELLDEARRRAWLQFSRKQQVDHVVGGIQRWTWGQITDAEALAGFRELARKGFEHACGSSITSVESDALAASAWLATAIVKTLELGPKLTPSIEINWAVSSADTYICAVFMRSGLPGHVVVPAFLKWALADDDPVTAEELGRPRL